MQERCDRPASWWPTPPQIAVSSKLARRSAGKPKKMSCRECTMMQFLRRLRSEFRPPPHPTTTFPSVLYKLCTTGRALGAGETWNEDQNLRGEEKKVCMRPRNRVRGHFEDTGSGYCIEESGAPPLFPSTAERKSWFALSTSPQIRADPNLETPLSQETNQTKNDEFHSSESAHGEQRATSDRRRMISTQRQVELSG